MGELLRYPIQCIAKHCNIAANKVWENIANACIAWTCHWLTFLGLYESTYSLHCTLNEYLLKGRLWLRVPYLGKENANLEVLSIMKLKSNHTDTTGGGPILRSLILSCVKVTVQRIFFFKCRHLTDSGLYTIYKNRAKLFTISIKLEISNNVYLVYIKIRFFIANFVVILFFHLLSKVIFL